MSEIPITVFLSVHNGAKFVGETINSILQQDFQDFEFLIIDDGSSDNSQEVIQSYADIDKRIRFLPFDKSCKFNATNLAFTESRGKYIAKIDHDDIATSDRLTVQYNFMQNNPDISLATNYIEFFGHKDGIHKDPIHHDEIKIKLLQSCALKHATAIFRKQDFLKYNLLYKDEFWPTPDYEFWTNIVQTVRVHNIPEVLLQYRCHDTNMSDTALHSNQQKKEKLVQTVNQIQIKYLQDFGLELPKENQRIYLNILDQENYYIFDTSELSQAHKICSQIIHLNKVNKFFDCKLLTNFFKSLLRKVSKRQFSQDKSLSNILLYLQNI